MTIEAGRPGEKEGIRKVEKFIKKLLLKSDFPHQELDNLKVHHTIDKIRIDPDSPFDFLGDPKTKNDFSFYRDIEELNFKSLEVGSPIGHAKNLPIVEDNNGDNCAKDFFYLEDGLLKTKKEFVPAMLTREIPIVLSDGLGYIMEKVNSI